MRKIHLIVMIGLFSCGKNGNPSVKNIHEKVDEVVSRNLEILPRSNEFVDGCSCYFSYDSLQFENKEYYFLNDYSYGYIKMQGKVIKLNVKSFVEDANEDFISEFFNDSLIVNIMAKKMSSIDETSQYQVSFNLYNSLTKIGSYKMVGECGC